MLNLINENWYTGMLDKSCLLCNFIGASLSKVFKVLLYLCTCVTKHYYIAHIFCKFFKASLWQYLFSLIHLIKKAVFF